MKTNKNFKWGFVFVFVAIITIPLAAQEGEGRGQGQGEGQGQRQYRQRTEEDVKKRVERLAESLDLSDEQEASLLAYDLEAYKKGKAFQEENAGDREAMRPYMQNLRKEREKKLAEILTDEQMAEYKEMQEQRRQEREQRQGQGKDQNSSNSGEETQRDRGRGAN